MISSFLDPRLIAYDMSLNRIPWGEYFMGIAYFVSMRSLDPVSKIGCVIIGSEDKSILTTGYNSPPRGVDDESVPTTRPEKYKWFVHAEEAAISNAARNGIVLDGSIMFITSMPCPGCMKKIINSGIEAVYFGNQKTSIVDPNSEDYKFTLEMARQSGVELLRFHEEKNIYQHFNELMERIKCADTNNP